MKRENVKQFAKANMSASGWLILYIVLQSVVMMTVMVYSIYHDEEFAYQFLLVFEPIVAMDDWFEKQKKTMEGLSYIMTNKMSIIMFTSSLLTIMITVLIVWRKRERIFSLPKMQEVLRYVLIGLLLNLFLTLVINRIPGSYSVSHELVEKLAMSGGLVLDMLATGILVPITEELIFRFGILRGLKKYRLTYAIVYQALIFGVLHGNIVQGLYAFALGLYFGYLAVKHDSITYGLMIHITINLSSVLVSYSGMREATGLFFLFCFCFLISATYRIAISIKNR